MSLGPLYVVSAVYLGIVVAFTFSLIEGDSVKEVARATVRRAGQLFGLLAALGVLVWLLDVI